MGDFNEFTNCVFGCAAILIGRFVFGLDWVCAIFLYFPASGLSRRILSNDGRGVVKCASMLVLYPFVAIFTPFLLRLCLEKVEQTGGASNEVGAIVLSAMIALVLLLGVFMAATFVANCIGDFSVPAKAHTIVARIMLAFASLLVIAAAIILMQAVDARYLHIPPSLKLAFTIMLMAALAFMLRRVFTGRMPERAMTASGGSKPSSVRLESNPAVKLSSVMGMDKAKEQIRLRLIEPVLNPDRARLYGLKIGGGVLLYGPPGTGKTMLARAVAGELNLSFYMITSADVFGKYVGESEQAR